MKRKFIAILSCLIMAFSTVVFVSACGKGKPVSVSRAKADVALTSAIEAISTSNAVKMEITSLNNNTFYVAKNDSLYQSTPSEGLTIWTEKSGNFWYEFFTISTMVGEFPGIDHNKCLSVKVLDDPRNFIVKTINDIELGAFIKASKYKGILTINYKLTNEEGTTQTTIKIKDSQLLSLKTSSKTMTFCYNEDALGYFAEKPMGIEWIPLTSKIVVEGLKNEYNVGDELDLTDAVLRFYKDEYSEDFEVLTLNSNMVTGFSTEELGTRTLLVNFCGLTFEVEYSVT